MKPSLGWLSRAGAPHRPANGRGGQAHLRHYTATYKVWGDGPPLVLIPGLAGGFELLGSLARLLSADFRVITYQIRGEEDPFALRQQFGLQDLTTDLEELLEWLGLERPVVMGVSFGSMLALELAARRPYHVDKLIVQGVGARYERTLLQRIAAQVLCNYPLPSDNAFVNQFFNLLFGSRHRSPSLFEHVTRLCWRTDQSVMAHRFRMVERFNILGRLRHVHVPTMLVAGRRDVLVTPASLRALRDELPECELVEMPNCGHLAAVTHSQDLADLVQRFALHRTPLAC